MYPNDREATYDYDAAGRLTKLNSGINNYNYNYDSTSNIKSIDGPNGTREYNYDKLDRLTGVSYPEGESINYSYDAMDNRIEKNTADGATEYSYNELNQLISAGDISYEYDKEGKLIKKETINNTFNYQYNAYDRLVKVKKDGTEIASYHYNPQGKRVSVTEQGNTTEYLWDGNSLLSTYVSGSREKLYAVGNGIDEVLGVYGEHKRYLHSNHLGSIKGITGTGGSVTGTRSYTPFGMVRDTTGSFNTRLGFIGRSQSDVTGLTYIRARYYDPSAGRFTKIDPIKDGLNWYGYAGANPVVYYDPYGLFNGWEVIGGTAQVISGTGQIGLGTGGNLIPEPTTSVGGWVLWGWGASNVAEGTGRIIDGIFSDGSHENITSLPNLPKSIAKGTGYVAGRVIWGGHCGGKKGVGYGEGTYLVGDTAISLYGTFKGLDQLSDDIAYRDIKSVSEKIIQTPNGNVRVGYGPKEAIWKAIDKKNGVGLINDVYLYSQLGN